EGLNKLFNEYNEQDWLPSLMDLKVEKKKAGKAILDAGRDVQSRCVAALVTRLGPLEKRMNALRANARDKHNVHHEKGWDKLRNPHSILIEMLRALLKRNLPLSDAELSPLLEWLGSAQPL